MPTGRTFLLRRHFSVHQASRRGGWAGRSSSCSTRAAGDGWLSEVRAHRFLDVIGPLGKPSPPGQAERLPPRPSEGHGSAPLYFLAQGSANAASGSTCWSAPRRRIACSSRSRPSSSRSRSCSRPRTAPRANRGRARPAPQGRRVDRAQVVYAAARRSTLRGIAEFCGANRIPSQVALEEQMACGTGLCFVCTVPVIRKDGSGYDNLRVCGGSRLQPRRVSCGSSGWATSRGLTPTPPEGFPVARSWPG